MPKWLAIIGIGEEGLAALTPAARLFVEQAEVICGGERHLAMLPPGNTSEKRCWSSPIADSVQWLIQQRGRPTCVLASGDPLCYGIGVTLLRSVPIDEMTIIPAPSAFSLACARLGWSFTEVEHISLCGRDPALLRAVLYPQARLLILSAGRQTPRVVAELLTEAGFGQSVLTVLERLGSAQERHITGRATSWSALEESELNTIAVECVADAGITGYSRLAGLPDSAYQHDGQLTKREVRAITLAALAPLPGQLLWDVGAGCGSIGIEWMRSHPRCRAIAIEAEPSRLPYLANNASALGTPTLEIIAGIAPKALSALPQPQAIFIGGGLTTPGLLDTCWQALPVGGRLVANAVTVESEQVLVQWHSQVGGSLTRIAIQRAEPIGGFLGWKPFVPVTQWASTVQP